MNNVFRVLRAVATAAVLFTCSRAQATQIVFLDFDTGTQGNINYTAPIRTAVRDLIAAKYSLFDYTITVTQPVSGDFSTVTQPVSGDFSTLTFNEGPLFGLADAVDFRNLDHSDNAEVNIVGWFTSPTTQEIINISANFGAHQLGHLSGLRHADSFGPIGSGIHDPPGPSNYLPTYPGPSNADETLNHIMDSPSTTGSPNTNAARSDLTFSERSAVKLAIAENDPTIAEQAGAHATMATAQPLSLFALSVPNPLVAGDNFGSMFEVEALNVTGSVSENDDVTDFYSFSASAGQIFNVELMSGALDRIMDANDDFDTELALFDSGGSLVDYFGVTATNDNEFETFDSTFIDWVVPAEDTYFLRVRGSPGFDGTGDYELYIYTFATVPEPGTFLLMAIGMAGAWALRCSRRRHSAA